MQCFRNDLGQNLLLILDLKQWQTIMSVMAVCRIVYFLLFYVVPLMDSNYESINGTMYIKEKKVMNSAHGHYGPDSLPLL